MITTTDDGWIVGDARALKAEGPSVIPLYSCDRPANYVAPQGSWPQEGETLLLRPAYEAISLAYPSPCYERSKVLRGAVAQWVRSQWGQAATGEPWEPVDAKYDGIRPGLERLFAHKLWERFDVIGSILHFALPKRETCATIDLVVRFHSDGGIGLVSIWNDDIRIHPDAVWADLGAAAEAMEISRIPVSKVVAIFVGENGIKLEAKGDDAGINDCILKWFEGYKRANQLKAANKWAETREK